LHRDFQWARIRSNSPSPKHFLGWTRGFFLGPGQILEKG
jgi:hypothetical protein